MISKRTKVPTPVIDAVLARDGAQLQAAIAAGGNIDETSGDGRTALHHACIEKEAELVDILLAAKARPDVADSNGMTPLHYAARSYQVGIAEKLVRSGVVVDAIDAHGNTPLFAATFDSKGRGDMIRLLLKAGADKNHTNKHGASPASLASTIANYDVAQWLKD
jgi:ankyrin repeat protein